MAQWVRSLDLTTHISLSPIWHGFAPGFVNYKKGCTRLTATSDQVYQLLAHGRWFSPGTLASSTTKNGCHDIAEILLKVALKHQKSNHHINTKNSSMTAFWLSCLGPLVFLLPNILTIICLSNLLSLSVAYEGEGCFRNVLITLN